MERRRHARRTNLASADEESRASCGADKPLIKMIGVRSRSNEPDCSSLAADAEPGVSKLARCDAVIDTMVRRHRA